MATFSVVLHLRETERMNTEKIIEQLQEGKEERAFAKLYKLYPKVEKYICINSGSKEEASDIFQEALLVLFNKIESIKTNANINIEGYIVNSCKLLWSNELRKKKVRKNTGEENLANVEYQDEIDAHIEKENKLKTIEEILKNLGEKCKSILEMFYFKNFSMEKIAKAFGYKAVQSAKAKKYKCMEYARKLAMQESKNNNL